MSALSRSVAALQLRAHDRADFVVAWPAIRARIAEAATNAELVVVPEGTVPAYVIGSAPVEPEILESAARDVIAIAAHTGATIVYGGGRYGDDDRFANSAYVVTGAGIVGSADKCFLWHFDRRWFQPGKTLEPIATPVGRLGVFICADGRIPTIASTLVDRGAEILVVPTAWVSSGRDAASLENIQADLFAAVRARENGVPLVVANKVGVEARSVLYCGKSQIIAADGAVVARASQTDEAIVRGSVAVGAPLVTRRATIPGVLRGTGNVLDPATRIAFALRLDAALETMAAFADATFTIDPFTPAASSDIAVVDDEAMLDPRALVGPRLDGVRLFVWHASIDLEWSVAFARTRAAELRAYVIVLDTLDRRAFAVDPDGVIIAGTGAGLELPAFTLDRARTDAWHVAPFTDVRAGLTTVAAFS